MSNPKHLRAKIIHGYLLPFETHIQKAQDILLFHHPRTSILLFITINLFYLALYLFRANYITVILLSFQIYRNFNDIFLFLEKRLLSKQIYDIPKNSKRQRFTIAEVSAFLDSIVYFFTNIPHIFISTVKSKDVSSICTIFTILILVFCLFSLLGDIWILCLLTNFILLIPMFARI